MFRVTSVLLLLAACARQAPPSAERSAPVAVAANEASLVAAPAGEAAASRPAPAAGHGAEAGCIYAGTESDRDPACPGGGPGAEPDPPTVSTGHFGAPFSVEEAVPLATAVNTIDQGQPVLVSGVVEAVCQKKGCWMVVKDGAVSARVLMKDHGFAVPTDARGKPVRVEGIVATRTFSEAEAKHLESDRGGDANSVSGARREYVVTATGIEIQG